jgi:type IV pilus assembly protein PilW
VNLKVQYGLDLNGDGVLDSWVSAATAGWEPEALLNQPPDELKRTLNKMKAVRIGIIVRSAQYDRELAKPYEWVLFDCLSHDDAACPGRLSGTIALEGGEKGGYRYRTYETVVPLRNQLWNRL